MKKPNQIFLIILTFCLTVIFCMPKEGGKVYLVGDSTMANKPPDKEPEKGWGQMFSEFFKDSVIIENHAQNGRSTKSFINEGRWQKILEKLEPGDYVFIQFGHNDSKISDSARYAEAHTLYKQNLLKMVNETKSRGAIPILLTPVNRRKFDKDSNFVDQHGDYPLVVRELAKEENILLIDIHKTSMDLFKKLGPEETKKIFLMKDKTGKEDNTHFNGYGAGIIAGMVASALKDMDIPLKKLIK
jgi:DNA sulfur modification protein DndE